MNRFLKFLLSLSTVAMTTILPIAANDGHEAVAAVLPAWSVIPFIGMLLSIAVIPLTHPHWWEKNMHVAAGIWSLVFIIPFAFAYGFSEAWFRLLESMLLDYVPFIVLLFGLFVAASGIAVRGTLPGTPKVNMLILFIGTMLASWIGTTGAAMVMIRPLIRANKWRKKAAHVIVFFIFLVANIGGCLTPLGDPPLFMGFQRGVPFTWTFHLAPFLLLNMIILFAAFYFIDSHFCKKELAEGRSPLDELSESEKEPIRIEIIIILVAAFLSLKTTKESIHELNEFSHAPIIEVATLFLGIFITMIPALIFLKVHGAQLGIHDPWQLFWATGFLSSFLDNTPTYLVFLQTAGAIGSTTGIHTSVGTVSQIMLEAISAGAVFMGANTYIGNAPNFMVKSIAEENGIKMPSFFGYMGWSIAILIPTFIIDMVVFFL